MRIAVGLFLAVVLSILGFGFYWQHRLAPLMNGSGMSHVPSKLELVSVSKVRPIDLGYAKFDIPAEISGEPVRHDGTLYLTIVPNPASRNGLTICPPTYRDDPETVKLVRDFASLLEEPALTWFELRKRALYTQPFSVWSVPFRGKRRSQIDAILLGVKALETGEVRSIRLFENPLCGVIIFERPRFAEVSITNKLTGMEQGFLLSPEVGNAIELASALAKSYRATTDSHDEKSLLALLAATGIRHQVNSVSESIRSNNASRLEAIGAEVRARRAKQKNR